MRCWPLILLVGCAPTVEDYDGDGVRDDQDCAPEDASIHPGATDAYGDDIDADCDGVDGVDSDGDGWPAGPDCADLLPSVHPGADDPPGDGIDQDCDGADGVAGDDDSDDDSGDDDSEEPAVLVGTVRRSATPTEDGVGTVWLSVLAESPITNPGATIVGWTSVPDADLSQTADSVSYRITDLPPRAAPYHVFAFLDDNGNASPLYATPDGADLVAMTVGAGVSVPTVVLTPGQETTLDVTLNLVYPF